MVNLARELHGEGQVTLEAGTVVFERGQGLLDWVEAVKSELKAFEVKQTN